MISGSSFVSALNKRYFKSQPDSSAGALLSSDDPGWVATRQFEEQSTLNLLAKTYVITRTSYELILCSDFIRLCLNHNFQKENSYLNT